MKIIASDIAMKSSRTFSRGTRETTNFTAVDGNRRIDLSMENTSLEAAASREMLRVRNGDVLELSREARRRGANPQHASEQGIINSAKVDNPDEVYDPKMELTRQLMEKLLGKKTKVLKVKISDQKPVNPEDFGVGKTPRGVNLEGGPPAQGRGFAFERTLIHHEEERTQFQAQGTVKTADGKEINFAVALDMAREFTSVEQVSIRGGALKDPLVINYDGAAADLSDMEFEFDLDADGDKETIHNLESGSAFLALDKNSNGSIDDGSELFGALTGDGFAELEQYDEDGNRFIDEGDSVYSKLSLYRKGEDGSDQLVSLKSAGVGAIYLDRVGTEFSINDTSDNTQRGQIRQTGIYLGEDGSVGTVQQVDLVAREADVEADLPQEPPTETIESVNIEA